jgi:exonuclease SbcC
MKLKKIIIRNFRGTKERVFNFKDSLNTISGKNMSGKTTIGEAILFAFTGNIRGTDKNKMDFIVNTNEKESSVIIETDTNLIIERTKDSKVSLKVNGQYMSQEQFELTYGLNQDKLLCGMWSGEFMKLDSKDRRDMIVSLFPKQDRAKIFKDLIGEEIYNNYYQLYKLDDLDQCLKQVRQELKSQHEYIEYNTQKKMVYSGEIAELQKTSDITIKYNVMDFENIKAKRQLHLDQEPKLENYLKNKQNKSGETIRITSLIDQSKSILRSLIQPSDSILRRMKVEKESYEFNMAKMRDSTMCPTCLRSYESVDEMSKVMGEFKKRLEDLEKAGIEEYNKYQLELKTYTGRKESLEQEIKTLEQEKEKVLLSDSSEFELSKKTWEENHSAWKSIYNLIEQEYQEELKAYESYTIWKNNKDNKQELLNTRLNDIKEIDNALKNNNIGELQVLENAFGINGIGKIELDNLLTLVKSCFPNDINIILTRPNKTNDGIRYVFELEDKYGVEYKWWSTGQKMIADIAISNMILEKSPNKFMVIDNLESLSTVLSIDSIHQIFTLDVKPTDLNLI